MAFKKKNPVIKDMMNSTKEEIEAKYTKEEYIKPTTKKEKTKEEKEKEEAHSKSIIANTKRILDEGRQEWDNRNRPGHAIELGMGPVIPETEITVTDAKGNPKTMTAAQAGFRQKQNNILGLIKTNAEERREAQKNGATAEELMLFDNRATDYTNQYKSLSPKDYNKNKAYIEEQIKMGDDDYATGVETTRSFYHNVDSFGKESGGNKARQSAFADLESMATKAPKFFKENGIAFISTYAGMLSEDEIEKESAKLSNIMYDSIWTPKLQAEYEAVSSVVNNANQKRNSSMNLGNVDQKGVRANVTYGYTYTPEEEAAIKRKAELEMIRSEAESKKAETDYYVTREWELSKYKDKYGYNWYTGTSEKADKKTSSRLIKWLYEDNFDRSAAAISDDSPNFEASVGRYELYQKAEKGEADSDDIKAAFKQIYGVDLSDKDLARLTIIAKEDDFSALSRYFSDIVLPDMNRAKEGKIAKSYEDIINNGSWLGKQGALAGGLFLSMLSSPYAAIESIGDAVDSNIKKTELPTYKTHLGYGQFSSVKSGVDKGRAELGTAQNADVLEFLGMDRESAEAWGGGIYGLTNSIAENLARSPLGVFGGAAMMFAQSFATEYKSGVDAYSDPTKNAIMSTVTAFSEGLTEKIELGALNKALDMTRFNPNHFKRMVKAARLSGANEVLGELTNDAVRYISDYALNGEESELYQQARKLVVDGKAVDVGSGMMQILIKNGLNTAVVSYISGMAFGGARGLFNYAGVTENEVRRDGEKLIAGGLNINELVRLGKESTNPETKKLALTIEQAVANGEGLDGFDVQMLFSGILNDSADEKIDVGETESVDVKVPMQSEESAEQNGDMESTINEAILDANNQVREANAPQAVKGANEVDIIRRYKNKLVKSKGIHIDNDFGYDLYAAENNIDGKKTFSIVEKSSGLEFGSGNTIEEAVTNATTKIESVGKEKIDQVIRDQKIGGSVKTNTTSVAKAIKGDTLAVGKAVSEADYTNEVIKKAKESNNKVLQQAAQKYSDYEFENDEQRYRAIGDMAKRLGVTAENLIRSRAKSLFRRFATSISDESSVIQKVINGINTEIVTARARGDNATIEALEYLDNVIKGENSAVSVADMFESNEFSNDNRNYAVEVYAKSMEKAFKASGVDVSISVYYDNSDGAVRGDWTTKGGKTAITLNGSMISGEQSAFWVLSHELFHEAESKAPGIAQRALKVFAEMGIYNEKQYEAYRNRYQAHENAVAKAENRNPKKLSKTYIEGEIAADLMSETMGSTELLEMFAGKLNDNDARVILSFLKKIASGIKNVFNSKDTFVNEFDKVIRDFEGAIKGDVQKGSDTEVTKKSLSSIGAAFYGNEKMTANEMERMLNDGSWKESEGYKKYLDDCVNVYKQAYGKATKSDIAQIEKEIKGIMRVAVAAKKAGYDILDNGAKRSTKDSKNRLLFTSLEPNSDYITSSDISAICDKRKTFTEIYDEIVRIEEANNVAPNERFFSKVDNYFILHKIMAEKGLVVPCEECYVESMRKNLAPMANAFITLVKETNAENKSNAQLYNQSGKNKGKLKENNAKIREKVIEICAKSNGTQEQIDKLKNLSADELAKFIDDVGSAENLGVSLDELTLPMLTTAEGLAKLKLRSPLLYEAFNSFYGQSKPKMPKEATPFRPGELIALFTDKNNNINQSLIKKVKSTGGFRLQSYSDFQIGNFVDVLQTIFEASMLGLNGHAYTKVPAFLDATDGTNLKRNLSIFMYEDGGKWMLDKKNSFPMELDDIYALVAEDESGNTSIIAVSQNAKMSAWIMANDLVGYGIPFHKSGLKMDIVRLRDVKTPDGRTIKGYSNQIDHTKQQSEVYKYDKDGKKKNSKVSKPIDIYSFWDFENKEGLSKNELIEKNLKAYIDECEKAGYRPKFRDYVMNNDKVLKDVLAYSKKLGFVSEDATIDDISFKHGEYTIPYGYYKFLGDFGMFTPEGEASPIKPLSLAEYDFDKAVSFFDDAKALREKELLQQFENGKVREEYRQLLKEGKMTFEELQAVLEGKKNEVVQEVVTGAYKDKKYALQGKDKFGKEYAPTFYSQMSKTIDGMKDGKIGANSVVSYLKGKGVKNEEIKWSGIETFLEGKKSVTKAELQEFVAGNQLEIEEETRDKNTKKTLKDKYHIEGTSDTQKLYYNGKLVETFTKDEDGWWSSSNNDYFSRKKNGILDAYLDGKDAGLKWEQYTLDGGKNYRELLFKLPNSTYYNGQMRAHWGNDAQGILAHARIQDFKVDGKKMLFIEEIQSDLHNVGHTQGYIEEGQKTTQDVRNESADAFREFVNSDIINSIIGRMQYEGHSKAVEVISELFEGNESAYRDVVETIGGLTPEEKAFIDNTIASEKQRKKQHESALPDRHYVPDAPFRDNYHEFVLKRLIREAAEKGYDSIGWTTADIQSKRWSDKFAEGYRIEYDQDIPKFLSKYGKKWGATVGSTVLKNGEEVWSMDIPDAMKESVLYEGQSRFALPGNNKLDAEYLELAKDPEKNEAKLQKIVDKAAVEAGVETDKHGKPVKLYHGTTQFGFTSIDLGKMDDKISLFATSSLETAGTYSGTTDVRRISSANEANTQIDLSRYEKRAISESEKIIKIFSKYSKGNEEIDRFGIAEKMADSIKKLKAGVFGGEVSYDFREFVGNAYYDFEAEYEDVYTDSEMSRIYFKINDIVDKISELFRNHLADKSNQGIYAFYGKTDNFFVLKQKKNEWNDLEYEGEVYTTRTLAEKAYKDGYYGVKIEKIFDDGGRGIKDQRKPADIYIFFKPEEQIWSADPVTYDDNGNVIPISERFNSEKTDIRYSLKGNNKLDSEYLELAKNPKKNEARLREMIEEAAYTNNYIVASHHGTPNGGFTEFGGHKTRNGAKAAGVYWFTEDNDHARVYTRYPGGYPQAENPMVYDVFLDIGEWADIGNGRVEAIDYSRTGAGEASTDLKRVAKAIAFKTQWNHPNESERGRAKKISDKLLAIGKEIYADFVWQITETQEFADLCIAEGLDSVVAWEEHRDFHNPEPRMVKTYGVFRPSQIKSADPVTYDDDGNVIPLSERFSEKDDIRWALSDNGNMSLEDAWNEKIEKYGAIPKGMNPARDVKVPKRISDNKYVSRTARSAIESGLTPEEFVSEFQKDILDGKFTYERFTDEKAEQKAKELIEYHGFEDALRHWDFITHSGGAISKENFAFGIELYNQCAQNGDFKNAEKILADISAEATMAGQAIQAMSMLKKMSPDGTLYYLERSIDKINDELVAKFGEKRAKKVKINEDLANRYFAEKDAAKREELYKELCKDIGEQIPSTFWEKDDAWRYLSMLFNPVTHWRNFWGNTFNLIVTKINNTIEGAIQPIFIKQEDRTKTLKWADKKTAEFAKNDWELMKDMLTSGEGKYGNVISDIDKYRRILRPTKNAGKVTKVVGNALGFAPEMLNKFNSWALEKEDMLFLGVSYRSALKKIITARKLDVDNISSEELSKIRELAIKEAKRATFREANALAEAISRTRAKLMKGNLVDKAGGIVLGGLFPFTKTPMNITKQSLETSPLGVFKTAYDIVEKSRGKAVSGNDIIADVARTFTGTGLFVLGAVLARAGVVSAGDDEDKDKKRFDKLVGEQSYAINFRDGKSYTIDWATPASIPFLVGAQFFKTIEEEGLGFKAFADSIGAITEPVIGLSMLDGLRDFLESDNYSDNGAPTAAIESILSNFVLQHFPTLGGKIKRIASPQKKNYYFIDKNSDTPEFLQELGGSIASKLPFEVGNYQASVDLWGRIENYGGIGERLAENLISPGYYSEDNYTDVDNEILRLYESTGNGDVFPKKMYEDITISGNTYYMNAEQYKDAAVMLGERRFDMLSRLFNDEIVLKNQDTVYSEMTDSEKSSIVMNVYKQALDETKYAMLDVVKGNAESSAEATSIQIVKSKEDEANTINKGNPTGVNGVTYVYWKQKNNFIEQAQKAIADGDKKNAEGFEKDLEKRAEKYDGTLSRGEELIAEMYDKTQNDDLFYTKAESYILQQTSDGIKEKKPMSYHDYSGMMKSMNDATEYVALAVFGNNFDKSKASKIKSSSSNMSKYISAGVTAANTYKRSLANKVRSGEMTQDDADVLYYKELVSKIKSEIRADYKKRYFE